MKQVRDAKAISKKQKEILSWIKPFCKKFLDKEYLELSTQMLNELSHQQQPLFMSGTAKSWAAGIVHAIGHKNFLFDRSFEPYCRMDDFLRHFDVSQATIHNKSKALSKFFDITQLDAKFATKYMTAHNPLLNIGVTSDGLIVPLNTMPEEVRAQLSSLAEMFAGKRGFELKREIIGREFIDEPHYEASEAFEDAVFAYRADSNIKKFITALKKIITSDPYFSDPYYALSDYYIQTDDTDKATQYLEQSAVRTKQYIRDDNGELPDLLEWRHIGNRHLIRSLLYNAFDVMNYGNTESAIAEFRYLLRANPSDDTNVRFVLLGILVFPTSDEFFDFIESTPPDKLEEWFDKTSCNFPEYFDTWKHEIDYPKHHHGPVRF